MYELQTAITLSPNKCHDPTLLSTFSENHDQPRFPSFNADMSVGLSPLPLAILTDAVQLAKNVVAFTLVADGIPIIYSGQEQHLSTGNDPYNRDAIWLTGYPRTAPLYVLIARLNKLRAALPATHFFQAPRVLLATDHVLAYRKGDVLAVYSNVGAGAASTAVAVSGTGWAAGSWSIDVLTNALVKVASDGSATITVTNGEPRVLAPVSVLAGTGLLDGVVIPS